MTAPYLLEIRTGGDTKDRLRGLIYDVKDRFGVRGAATPRAVPHITLFGPYNTNRGRTVKRAVIDVLDGFDVVPYRIDGFGRFKRSKVIYANVVPSPELRALRRELSRRLRPLCYNHPPYDSDHFYEYHITIAFKDVGRQFDDIWAYVNREYDLKINDYATRVSSLDGRRMMWEHDLLNGDVYSRDVATSARSWERTMDTLGARAEPTDHDLLSPQPNRIGRYAFLLKARAKSMLPK